jgi:hypothetical protein
MHRNCLQCCISMHCCNCCPCREEIASCAEASYSSLKLADAQVLMMMSSNKELQEYAQQVRGVLLRRGRSLQRRRGYCGLYLSHCLAGHVAGQGWCCC